MIFLAHDDNHSQKKHKNFLEGFTRGLAKRHVACKGDKVSYGGIRNVERNCVHSSQNISKPNKYVYFEYSTQYILHNTIYNIFYKIHYA